MEDRPERLPAGLRGGEAGKPARSEPRLPHEGRKASREVAPRPPRLPRLPLGVGGTQAEFYQTQEDPQPLPHTSSLCSRTRCAPSRPPQPTVATSSPGLKWPFPSQLVPGLHMELNRFFFDLPEIISHVSLKGWLDFFFFFCKFVSFFTSVGQQADTSLWLERLVI